MSICNNDNACPSGSKCLQPANAGACGSCPYGYSCTGGQCVADHTGCVGQQTGINPAAATPCSPACDASSFCDPTHNTCKPQWGCELTCNSCPGGNPRQLSTPLANLASA